MSKKATASLFDTNSVEKEGLVDVEIKEIRRKRFRINHDDDKIVELNVADLNIADRLASSYKELTSIMDEVAKTIPTSAETDEDKKKAIDALNELNKAMCEQIDYVFDYPVSEKLADGGSMWDPIDGQFRYEIIIEKLASLYENNLSGEFEKMKKRMDKKIEAQKRAVSKYHK